MIAMKQTTPAMMIAMRMGVERSVGDDFSAMLSFMPSFSVVTGTLVLMSMGGTTEGVFDPLVLVIDDDNVVDDGFDAVDDACVESDIANGVGCGVGSGVGGTGVGANYNDNDFFFNFF